MSESELKCDFKPTRNYTGEDEKGWWWYAKRWDKDYTGVGYSPSHIHKELFRQRRGSYFYYKNNYSTRINFGNNNEIGAFIRLTNTYSIVAPEEDPKNFSNLISDDSPENPVVNTSISGCNVVGRLCVGNSRGLLLPDIVQDTELDIIKRGIPDTVKVHKVEEQLSALGNVIACNDKFAIVHPDINKVTEEVIADTLQVEVFKTMIGNNPLVGSYCVFNNKAGIVSPNITNTELENLASLLQIPLHVGTVNFGCQVLGAGLVINDSKVYAGMKTTSHEFKIFDSVLIK